MGHPVHLGAFPHSKLDTPEYSKTIEFLDHLHALLDNIMDEFDVYKVETVNNTCLIASGE